ncbi:LpxI family protein [Microbaculum sp. FT89]|uniref:LpxI family protein n=1 Tax=Microbaculum sp. FT89 TaxID=3447298 RepID=UPI003F52F0A5
MLADPASREEASLGPLAIIAGAGDLPRVVAEEVRNSGRSLFVIEVEGEADADFSTFATARLPIGAAGRLKALLVERKCRDVLMAGNFRRPRFSDIEWDMSAVKAALLPAIMRLKRGGDDKVVNGVVQIFESEGFRIVGPADVVPRLVAPTGPLGRLKPGRKARADIDYGFRAIRQMGPFDIGQAVVVLDGRVIAVEAAEGTNAMVARCSDLRREGRIAVPAPSGVLIKSAKPGQELRLDMPVAGEETIRVAKDAGLEGIAVETGKVLVPRIDDVRRAADEAGLFFVGIDTGSGSSRGS